MTTRLEAVKTAIRRVMVNRTYDRHAYDDDVFSEGVADITKEALTASDAVLLSDATVERAAHVLYDHREDALTCYDHDNGWCCICGEHEIDAPWFEHAARAVLAAAVKEDGE